jgi:NTE family protein
LWGPESVYPKIGLALSGGGARGLAHIGVLKVLEREGIPVDLLAGTSMGGVIAAGYAAGLDAAYLEQEALHLSRWRNLLPLVDRSLPGLGLVSGERVRDYLASHVGEMTFDQLRVPLALVAVDLLSGKEVVLQSGVVADAVRATISLPGVFAPFPLDGRLLVDGGILNNLPADVVRRMGAEVVVAVNVSADAELLPYEVPEGNGRLALPEVLHMMASLRRVVSIMVHQMADYRLAQAQPDLVLHPCLDLDITLLGGFPRAGEIVAAGEAAAEEAVPRLRQMVAG